MDDFGMLARDFGFRPQGKSAPMKSDGRPPPPPSSSSSATVVEEDRLFNDVFSSPAKHSNSKSASSMSDFDYDAIFKNSVSTNNEEAKSKHTSLNLPVYDKPVYDDDIFDGLPGLKSKSMSSSASPRFEENIFASMAASPPKRSQQSDDFDDLMENLGRTRNVEHTQHDRSKSPSDFDDLIPGFGSGNPASTNRSNSEPIPKSTANTNETKHTMDNPFGDLESTSTTDPLEEIGNFSKFGNPKTEKSSVSDDLFDNIDPLNGFNKPTSTFTSEKNNRAPSPISKDSTQKASFRNSENQSPVDEFQESHKPVFDIPPLPKNPTFFEQSTSPPSYTESNSNSHMGMPPTFENVQVADEIWLTVSEIPLVTQPTLAPPPSRPPPPKPIPKRSNSRKYANGSSSLNSPKHSRSHNPFQPMEKSHLSPPLYEHDNLSSEEMDSTLASAAMKEAMDKAEAKFRHAKEVRERENAKASRNKEIDERKQREIEREKGRQAVERATKEARERAALEAREKASNEARLKHERAAVQRAQAEARERAAVGAKERAERAAAEAKEKEVREKVAAAARVEEEARRRSERAAVERVAAEARKRAAVEARDRAAAASRASQQKNDDFEAFFGGGTRPSSAPRPRATSSESASDPLSQNRRGPERTSTTGVSSNMRKASSTTNIVDDLSSIFGGAPQFQEVEGETEERRRARLEREQRTQERAAKALAEKNQRDLQTQRDQEERNRIGGTLDTEIKRWAAGKEGNLRALLSTLQYVLWPECGWQPVSLTDLITGANVKKAYRKATLCIHPDKVQQKGANLQQKYVAEKVFDILKEAWNKFNSEELF